MKQQKWDAVLRCIHFILIILFSFAYFRFEKMAEEIEHAGGNLPAELLGQLQPKFGPIGPHSRTTPFRHHALA